MSDSQQTLSPPPAFDASGKPPAGLPKNGLGLAALIVGITALVGSVIPFVNYVSGVLAIAGVVLGIIALLRKGKAKGQARAGLIISGVAVVLSVVLAIVYTVGFVAAVDDAQTEAITKGLTELSEPASPDAPAEDAPAGDELGTRGNPAPLGTTIVTTVGGADQYEITLGASTLDANAIIAAENQFNEAPAAGLQYAIIPITVTYTGDATGTPWMDLNVEFVSAAGTTHTTTDALVAGPAPLSDINELYPGGSGTGNVVIAIPTADAANGTWVVSQLFETEKFYSAAQ